MDKKTTTKVLLSLAILSSLGAYYGIACEKQQMKEKEGEKFDELQANDRLLKELNGKIQENKEIIKNSRNIFRRVKSLFSLAFLMSDKLFLEKERERLKLEESSEEPESSLSD